MDIEVKNPEQAIIMCNEILTYNKQSAEVIESLEKTLNEINRNWESTGYDKQSYVVELKKQINNLKIIHDETNNLGNSIIKYAEHAKSTSEKQIND